MDDHLQPLNPIIAGINGGPPRPVAVLTDELGTRSEFVLGEMIVQTNDESALNALLLRWNGRILLTTEFPEDLQVPKTYLIAVDPTNANITATTEHLRKATKQGQGAHTLSSIEGLRLLAAAASELTTSNLKANLNFIARPAGLSDSLVLRSTNEEPVSSEPEWSPNAFNWPYMLKGGQQNIGVAEAWRKLELVGRLGRNPAHRVRVAILDAGFVPSADFPDSLTIYPPGAYNIPNTWGCSTGPGCVWHGTDMVHALAGKLDNNSGAAGPGGPVVDLVMAQSPALDFAQIFHYISSVIPNTLLERPRIINMSFGLELPAIAFPITDIFGLITSAVHRSGVLIVGIADNRNWNVDHETCFILCWESIIHVPCEVPGVLCVGGLAWNSTRRADFPGASTGSNYGQGRNLDGHTVEIFGPYELWVGSNPTKPEVHRETGTSVAAPFVAGVAALIWSANPLLHVDAVEQILMDTAHTATPDPTVPRWINADGAITRALGTMRVCEPPQMQIRMPMSNTTYLVGSTVTFAGQGHDLSVFSSLPSSALQWFENDVLVGSGSELTRTYWTAGTYRISLLGTGCSAVVGERLIWIHVVDNTTSPGNVEILNPANGSTFQSHSLDSNNLWFYDVQLTGIAAYSDGTPVPGSRMRWRSNIDGELGTGSSLTAKLHSSGLCDSGYHTITLEILSAANTVITTRTIGVTIYTAPC